MIGFPLCIVAFIGTLVAARRSLAAGLQALLVCGYLYGLARGRYPDGFTHFMFDCSLLALYIGCFAKPLSPELEHRSETASLWTRALMAWPLICMAYSSFLEGAQPFVVQIVGLRSAALMLPCLILGARIQKFDLDRLAPTIAVLNIFALAVTAVEYVYGVAAVVPENLATELIYASHDIVAQHEVYHRLPSLFISSHMYGGTMMLSVPFVLHGLEGAKGPRRIICAAGLAAAGIGVFACGARSPVVALGVTTIYALTTLRMRFTTLLSFGIVAASIYYLVTHNERLQRFETLGDTDFVQARIGTSVNSGFLNLVAEYPIGAGLASAFGTSVPYFMRGLANPPIGIENEYGHLVVEQGIVGLLLWVAFIAWLLTRTNSAPAAAPAARAYATAIVFVHWITAATGVGILAAMPATPLFLFLCGLRSATAAREKTVLSVRHVGQLRTEGPLRSAFAGRTPNRARFTAPS